jgi:hypothetical protein
MCIYTNGWLSEPFITLTLMMEAVSEILDYNCILMLLITQEDFIAKGKTDWSGHSTVQ